ncbi:hypothetical protein LTS18_008356, partial [Coniosporium uncinatum]
GAGNQVSAEFNLVYRWHSTISERDEKWTEELWQKLFPGKHYKDVGWHEFAVGAQQFETKLDENSPDPEKPDPMLRPFAGLKRKENGSFNDDELCQILIDSIEDCANSFGAQRVPPVMRAIDILGIMQARVWNLATLNEFRVYFGLEPHRTFEDINPDPQVAQALRHLYNTPDLVEMYPGLVCEEAKEKRSGAGLCPGFTVSRAVLSDAVALVRGDRFYTIDYHPRKLTNWGFTEVASDKTIDNGCMFYKLFLRAFPSHFEPDSIYAHYPLTEKKEMQKVLLELNKLHLYSTERPVEKSEPIMIKTYAAAEKILSNKDTFKVTWGKAMEFLMGDAAKDFMLAGDGPKNAQSRDMMEKGLYVEKWEQDVKEFYERTTLDLLKSKSYKLGELNQVDIIRDVGNLAHVHFGAELFEIPLKSTDRELNLFTEHELYMIMAAVFICVFFDLDPGNSFPLRVKAREATQALGQIVVGIVSEIKAGGWVSWAVNQIAPETTSLKQYGRHMIKRLLNSGMDVKQLVWGHIMGTAGGMVANQGQLFAQTMEYFLCDPEGQKHLPEINRLAKSHTDESFAKLEKYFLEGSRLYGETGVFREVTENVTIQDGEKTLNLKAGDRVLVNLKAASRDPKVFLDPDVLKLDRPIDSYIHLGHGPHQCLGWKMTRVSLTTMLKVIGGLDGLRTATGPQGRVQKVLKPFSNPEDNELPDTCKYHAYLTEKHDKYFPFPCSLKVNWD